MQLRVLESLREFKDALSLQVNPAVNRSLHSGVRTKEDVESRELQNARLVSVIAANLDSGSLTFVIGGSTGTELKRIHETAVYNLSGHGGVTSTIDLSSGVIKEIPSSSAIVYSDINPEVRTLKQLQSCFDQLRSGGVLIWDHCRVCGEVISGSTEAITNNLKTFLSANSEIDTCLYLRSSSCVVFVKGEIIRTESSYDIPYAELPAEEVLFQDDLCASMKTKRFIYAYGEWDPKCSVNEKPIIDELCAHGYDVVPFPLECPGGWWPFPKLDHAWRTGDPHLVQLYAKLKEVAESSDVLIAAGGSMLHPEFVESLPTFNVFVCADDPESSDFLSKPVCKSFDYCFPMNIACIQDYKDWGCEKVGWFYHSLMPSDPDYPNTVEEVLYKPREYDIFMLCERIYGASDRAQRIEKLVESFPQATVRGKGWPGGFFDGNPFPSTHIGWNLHNSIGPTNSRTITLPACGTLQICDNKAGLSQMFELDVEVVGFDTLEECIDKTRYYLDHWQEGREIAARGWQKVMKEYTLIRQWERMVQFIAPDCISGGEA